MGGKHIFLFLIVLIVLTYIILAFRTPHMFDNFTSGLTKITGRITGYNGDERIIRKGFDGYGVVFSIPRDKINQDFRKDRKRTRSGEYLTSTNEYIVDFAYQLRNSAIKNKNDTVLYVINFVQKLPYEKDFEVGFDDYPKYPTETLFEGRGDCEDTSYLLYSLLEALGHDVILIFIPKHVMVGIACTECQGTHLKFHDKDYYFIETTNTGFNIGDFPEGQNDSIQEIIKNENTDNFTSIKCWKEKVGYNVKEEYWADVPYQEKVAYTVDVPYVEDFEYYVNVSKEVGLMYSIVNKYKQKMGILDCFGYGLGANCYKIWVVLRNDDNNDGSFKYVYEVKGNQHSQTFKERSSFIKAGETINADSVVFDTSGEEVIENINVYVTPPKKTISEKEKRVEKKEMTKQEVRYRYEDRTKKEKKTRTVTKYYYRDRCI